MSRETEKLLTDIYNAGFKLAIYVMLSPILLFLWIIGYGSAIGCGAMKLTGAKPYKSGRR